LFITTCIEKQYTRPLNRRLDLLDFLKSMGLLRAGFGPILRNASDRIRNQNAEITNERSCFFILNIAKV